MRRVCFSFAIVSVTADFAMVAPAGAAPPTVTPTPGYDARLQEPARGADVLLRRSMSRRRPARGRRPGIMPGVFTTASIDDWIQGTLAPSAVFVVPREGGTLVIAAVSIGQTIAHC